MQHLSGTEKWIKIQFQSQTMVLYYFYTSLRLLGLKFWLSFSNCVTHHLTFLCINILVYKMVIKLSTPPSHKIASGTEHTCIYSVWLINYKFQFAAQLLCSQIHKFCTVIPDIQRNPIWSNKEPLSFTGKGNSRHFYR